MKINNHKFVNARYYSHKNFKQNVNVTAKILLLKQKQISYKYALTLYNIIPRHKNRII